MDQQAYIDGYFTRLSSSVIDIRSIFYGVSMKILDIDIETAPDVAYVWGHWNQNIAENQIVSDGYTLSFAAKWRGSKKIIFHSIEQDGFDNMIQAAWDLLNEADAVVHYNGIKFDIPTLNREFLLAGLPPPDPYFQIDLLKTVRQKFKFPRNTLNYVCRRLGIGSKHEHKGMELWHDCMHGNEKAWRTMEKYNKQDVRLLDELYDYLLPWIKDHPNFALYGDTENPVCPKCGSEHVIKKGMEHLATQSYQRYRCKDCGSPLRGRYTLVPKDKRPHILTTSKL